MFPVVALMVVDSIVTQLPSGKLPISTTLPPDGECENTDVYAPLIGVRASAS